MDSDKACNKKRALVEKDLGNSYYKKKDFKTALESYNRAISLDPTNITFYTNKAAVYFEKGEHDRCRAICLEAVDIGKLHNVHVKLIAKAYARIGNSYMKEKRFVDAKTYFSRSNSEHKNQDIIEKIEQCEVEIREAERLAYINPDISRQERLRAQEASMSGNQDLALVHFMEAIKRNPEDAQLYFDRASVFMTLKDHESALNDCNLGTEKDPTSATGYLCKGGVLEAMKKYDAAMDNYQKALDIDPKLKDASKAYYRCLTVDYEQRNNPKQTFFRAQKSPAISEILSDSEIKSMLNHLNDHPDSIQEYLEDPEISPKIQKLIDYGIIGISP